MRTDPGKLKDPKTAPRVLNQKHSHLLHLYAGCNVMPPLATKYRTIIPPPLYRVAELIVSNTQGRLDRIFRPLPVNKAWE
jgi:hypothetical protein